MRLLRLSSTMVMQVIKSSYGYKGVMKKLFNTENEITHSVEAYASWFDATKEDIIDSTTNCFILAFMEVMTFIEVGECNLKCLLFLNDLEFIKSNKNELLKMMAKASGIDVLTDLYTLDENECAAPITKEWIERVIDMIRKVFTWLHQVLTSYIDEDENECESVDITNVVREYFKVSLTNYMSGLFIEIDSWVFNVEHILQINKNIPISTICTLGDTVCSLLKVFCLEYGFGFYDESTKALCATVMTNCAIEMLESNPVDFNKDSLYCLSVLATLSGDKDTKVTIEFDEYEYYQLFKGIVPIIKLLKRLIYEDWVIDNHDFEVND